MRLLIISTQITFYSILLPIEDNLTMKCPNRQAMISISSKRERLGSWGFYPFSMMQTPTLCEEILSSFLLRRVRPLAIFLLEGVVCFI
jgi:hypothetical protein